MITPTWVSTRCQPIAIENVLGYLVGVLSSADTTGEVFDIGGREILTYRDIMRIMAEELELPRRWILPVPLLTPRLSSHWIQLVTPFSRALFTDILDFGARVLAIQRADGDRLGETALGSPGTPAVLSSGLPRGARVRDRNSRRQAGSCGGVE